MHADLHKLFELQQTDAEVSRLNQEIAAFPRRVAEIETKLAAHLADVEKAKAATKINEQNRRKHEGDIQSLQQKISKYRDQMLAVKTNDEYRALGNEIKFAEEAIRGSEDKILDCMVEAENLDTNIKAAEKALTLEQAEVEKEKSEARSRTAEDENALQRLMPRRAELRAGIDENTLRHYDRLLKQRGSAISEIRDQICLACHVTLRPQVYNDVRSGEKLLTCDSCGRILYFDPAYLPNTPEKTPDKPAIEADTEDSPSEESPTAADGGAEQSGD
jgi:uncharacterized protein